MLVTIENSAQAFESIAQAEVISIDTETTGLRAYHGDQIFSLIVSTKKETFYFNFNEYPGIEPLPTSLAGEISRVFELPSTKILHNAKFDLSMLSNFGVRVGGNIFDLWTLDRLHDNQHFAYQLADVAKRWGREKSKVVDQFIKEHKLSKVVEVPHLNKKYHEKYFALVDFEIMHKYAENDARITFDIAMDILEVLQHRDKTAPANWPKLMDLVMNEARLTQTLFRMEQVGVQTNPAYCEEARQYYENIVNTSAAEFKKLTGLDFVKGETVFAEVFKDEPIMYTEKGNPIFDAKSMKRFTHPASNVVVAYSEAKKQLEYFQNFIWFADKNGVIHTDQVQAGTTTGRLSNRDPNLQNLTKPDKYGDDEKDSSKYPVRRALVPRPGFFLAMLDYSQVEYRVMLDIARANALINEILGGLDVHGATSKLAGVTRSHAKTVNFLTLYGGGAAKLAMDLFATRGSLVLLQVLWKIYLQENGWKYPLDAKEKETAKLLTPELREHNLPLLIKAKEIQDTIFKASPEIRDFIKTVQKTAKDRGYIRNWMGRRYHFSNKNFCYKAPNHLIQGSCADILKVAMNRIDERLLSVESRLIADIHDELVLEVKFGEEYIVDECKKIMEAVYPYRRLPLLVEVEYSLDNLADKTEWDLSEFMSVKESRNTSQRAHHSEAQSAPQ